VQTTDDSGSEKFCRRYEAFCTDSWFAMFRTKHSDRHEHSKRNETCLWYRCHDTCGQWRATEDGLINTVNPLDPSNSAAMAAAVHAVQEAYQYAQTHGLVKYVQALSMHRMVHACINAEYMFKLLSIYSRGLASFSVVCVCVFVWMYIYIYWSELYIGLFVDIYWFVKNSYGNSKK